MLDEKKGGREDEKMQGLYLQDPKFKQTVLAHGHPGSGRHKRVAMTTKEGVVNLSRLPRVCIHPPATISTRTEVLLSHC